jgi:hypothetical protein
LKYADSLRRSSDRQVHAPPHSYEVAIVAQALTWLMRQEASESFLLGGNGGIAEDPMDLFPKQRTTWRRPIVVNNVVCLP